VAPNFAPHPASKAKAANRAATNASKEKAMQIDTQANPDLEKLGELIGGIKFAMMTTADDQGSLHSRPMSCMQMDGEGNLWFFTSASSGKVHEALAEQQVNVSWAHPDKQDYVSVSGRAAVVRDEAKMKSLWTPWIKPWFPKGLADPDLVLMKVTIEEYEYWDAPGNAVKRAYGFAKAMLTGKTDALGENKSSRLH
jgi:general stress protein 26